MRSNNKMPHPLQQAVDEQAKCAFLEPVCDRFGQAVKGIWATKHRRTETILNEAVDKNWEVEKRQDRKRVKRTKRRRRRGPRVYSVRF